MEIRFGRLLLSGWDLEDFYYYLTFLVIVENQSFSDRAREHGVCLCLHLHLCSAQFQSAHDLIHDTCAFSKYCQIT